VEILAGCREVMEELEQRMRHRLAETDVRIIYGNPELLDAHRAVVEGQTIHFSRLVLATGTEPEEPEGLVLDGKRLMTYREALLLEEPPDSLLILGGDVEGLEFASLFSEMGTRVIVLEMQPQIMAAMDEDLTEPVYRRLEKNGVILHPRTMVAGAEVIGNGIRVETPDGRVFEAEKALTAMARKASVPVGIERTGLSLQNGRLPVDDQCRTAVSHIYCIGDLNGRLEMAHTALQQGLLLADYLAEGTPMSWHYGPLPRTLYTLPQNGGAGLQENQLKKQGIDYQKSVIHWNEVWRGVGQAEPEGFLKVLAGIDGTILGIWMSGAEISEQVNLMGLVVSSRMTLEDVKRHLWAHPTRSEALLQAVLNLS